MADITPGELAPDTRLVRVQVFGPRAGTVTVTGPSDPVEHRFTGMQSEPNEPPLAKDPAGPRRWRGTCACGHTEAWTTVKDWAWQEIAAHFVPLITGARPWGTPTGCA